MLCRVCVSLGKQLLQTALPHSRATGLSSGYEHFGHWTSLTICRACFVASRGPSVYVSSRPEASLILRTCDCFGREVLLRGSEDIKGDSTWRDSAHRFDSSQYPEGIGPRPRSNWRGWCMSASLKEVAVSMEMWWVYVGNVENKAVCAMKWVSSPRATYENINRKEE